MNEHRHVINLNSSYRKDKLLASHGLRLRVTKELGGAQLMTAFLIEN